MKSLTEEQKRMRELMGFTYKDNSHDILSEQTINEAVNFYGLGDTFYYIQKKGRRVKLIPLGVLKPNGRDFVFGPKLKKITNKWEPGATAQWSQLVKDRWWEYWTEQGNIVRDTQLEDYTEKVKEAYENYANLVDKTEKAFGGADWDGTNSGTIILKDASNSKYPAASNIKLEKVPSSIANAFGTNLRWNLLTAPTSTARAIKYEWTPPNEPTERVTLEEYKVNNVYDTYCPNMVQPNFSKQEVKREFDALVDKISKFITYPDDENGVSALSKLNRNLTILGQADASSPGWWGGKPCNTNIDHDYGGEEKKPKDERDKEMLHRMNLYLATHRAKNYKNALINAVKEVTGKDITIREKSPIEYYGKGDSFKGKEYRSINLNFNNISHTFVSERTEDGEFKRGEGKVIKDLEKQGFIMATIDVNLKGGNQNIKCLYQISDRGIYLASKTVKGLLPKLTFSVEGTISSSIDLILKSDVGDIKLQSGQPGIKGASRDIEKSVIQSWLGTGEAGGSQSGRAKNTDFQVITWGYPAGQGKGVINGIYDCYDTKDTIKVNGEDYYKLTSRVFALYDDKLRDKDNLINYPSEEEILELLVRERINYTPKQIESLIKQAGKYNKNVLKLLKKLNKINTQTKGEEIQSDIQYN
jgi:hypothetical protein